MPAKPFRTEPVGPRGGSQGEGSYPWDTISFYILCSVAVTKTKQY